MKKGNYLLKILLMSIVIFGLQNKIYAQPPNNGWQYYRDFSLNTATPSANYQIRVQLTSGQYTNINSSGNDLRFTVGTSSTLCDYYIETWNTSGTSTIWVEVPNASTNSLRMWYGNGSASAASDGDATFLFFDAFNGSSVNTSKWTVTANSPSVSGGIAYFSSVVNSGAQIIAKTGFSASTGFLVESIVNSGSGSNCGARSSYCGITSNSTSVCGLDYGGCGTFTAFSNGINGTVIHALLGQISSSFSSPSSGTVLGLSLTNSNHRAYINSSNVASKGSSLSGTFYPVLCNMNYTGCGSTNTISIAEIRVRNFSESYNPSVNAGNETAACNIPTVPTFSTSASGCNTSISIATGNLNDAANWQWYSGSCGGTSVGSGTSITVSPTVTTNYFARGEGGCTGICGTISVVLSPSTPTLNLTNTSSCNTTLSIASGNLNGATDWQWYSGSCGGTSIGSGTSVTVTPTATTTYFARGEGGCASPGSCESITVNVSPSTPTFSVTSSGCNNTISIATGNLNGAANWQWYSGSCGGTSIGSGTSVTVSPSVTTTYFARGEGGCLASPESCGTVAVNANTNLPSFTLAASANNQCPNTQISLSAQVQSERVYLIPLSQLINVPYDCGNGSLYGYTAPGFKWTDAGTGTVTNVKVEFQMGVVCSGATTPSLNSLAGSSFTPTYFCDCSMPSSSPLTVNFANPSGYTVGGTNQFTFSTGYYGFAKNSSFSYNYARVTVTYAGGNLSYEWTPGNATTQTINVSPSSTTAYSCKATNSLGCSTTKTITVTVASCCTAPTIACPSNVSVNTSMGACGANVAFSATSTGTSPTFTYSPTSGSFFAVGTTTVTATATNSCGTDQCTFNVIVTDTEKPTAICKNITVDLDNTGNATIASTDVNNGSNDACGIKSLSIDRSSFNCSNIGTNTVTLTVTDNNDNESTCTSTVTVQDKVKPTAICKNVTVDLDNTGNATIASTDVNNGSNDACGIKSLSIDRSSFNCSNIGTNTVTLTVTDNNDNESTCTSTVTVQDKVKPTAICKNITVDLDNMGNATIASTDVNNGSNDACGIKSITVSPTSFNCTNIGKNTVILTVTDASGNSSTCDATVTVVGTIPTVSISQGVQPVFCQGGAVVLSSTSNETVTYAWSNNATTANTNVYASGTYSLTVTNSYGCTKSASTTVTYSQTDLLSSYTILTTGEAEIEKESVVKSGGVGSKGTKEGEVEVSENSLITASGTFAKAKEIEVKSGSSVTNAFSGAPVSVSLPTFAYNPHCDDKKCDHKRCDHKECKKSGCSHSACNHGTNDIKAKKDATVVITDSIFRKIQIESGATITFTSKNIYAETIETEKNVTIKFAGCTRIFLCKDFKISENNVFNSANNSVIIYAEKKAEIQKGTKLIANIYTLDEMSTKGDKSNRNSLTGMYIAQKMEAHYTDFSWNTICGSCGTMGKKTLAADLEGLRDASTDYVSVYPNPTNAITTVSVNVKSEGTLKITVINIAGELLYTTEKSNFTGLAEIPIDMTTYAVGMYFVKVQYGDTVKLFKIHRLN